MISSRLQLRIETIMRSFVRLEDVRHRTWVGIRMALWQDWRLPLTDHVADLCREEHPALPLFSSTQRAPVKGPAEAVFESIATAVGDP